jgi:hypothetical protein
MDMICRGARRRGASDALDDLMSFIREGPSNHPEGLASRVLAKPSPA